MRFRPCRWLPFGVPRCSCGRVVGWVEFQRFLLLGRRPRGEWSRSKCSGAPPRWTRRVLGKPGFVDASRFRARVLIPDRQTELGCFRRLEFDLPAEADCDSGAEEWSRAVLWLLSRTSLLRGNLPVECVVSSPSRWFCCLPGFGGMAQGDGSSMSDAEGRMLDALLRRFQPLPSVERIWTGAFESAANRTQGVKDRIDSLERSGMDEAELLVRVGALRKEVERCGRIGMPLWLDFSPTGAIGFGQHSQPAHSVHPAFWLSRSDEMPGVQEAG